jgi:hypothetical protein
MYLSNKLKGFSLFEYPLNRGGWPIDLLTDPYGDASLSAIHPNVETNPS